MHIPNRSLQSRLRVQYSCFKCPMKRPVVLSNNNYCLLQWKQVNEQIKKFGDTDKNKLQLAT